VNHLLGQKLYFLLIDMHAVNGQSLFVQQTKVMGIGNRGLPRRRICCRKESAPQKLGKFSTAGGQKIHFPCMFGQMHAKWALVEGSPAFNFLQELGPG
jgi:hypothetical protein